MSAPQPAPGFVDIRDEAGRLLCRYDPARQLIEIKRRHDAPAVIDLKRYQEIVAQTKQK